MTINNKKFIRITIAVLTVLIVFDLLALLFVYVFKTNILCITFLSFMLLVFMRNVFNLRYFSLESFGEIISIKYHHPLVKQINYSLEMPLRKIISCNIEKAVFKDFIILSFANLDGKKLKIHYKLQGISKKQIQELKLGLLDQLKIE